MQGIARSCHAALPAAKNRSASSCQIQNHSLISQGKKGNPKKPQQHFCCYGKF
jgi:hypothetical protein